MIAGQARAIVWAQWRSVMNFSGRSRRFPFVLIFSLLWYGMWTFGAYGVAQVASDPDNIPLLVRGLPLGLLIVTAYWQFVPVMMVTSGLSLDLARLLVYPVAHSHLFGIEVALRVTTAIEMLIISMGLAVGVARNPGIAWWAPLALIPFTLLNLFLSAGVRDLFTRMMARKGFREATIFIIVLLAAIPQVLLMARPSPKLRHFFEGGFGTHWPWSNAATLVLGSPNAVALVLLVGWTGLAYWFGRRQFERTLLFDAAESRSKERAGPKRSGLIDWVLRAPSVFLRDPLAALVEKEVRFLSRAPRFRLLFMMGFSFGLLIWLPLTLRSGPESAIRGNYLTIVSAYALLLLGEVCFWNNFGMDRSAAQTYFVMPVSLSTVLVAKNIAAIFFILLEILLVAVFCLVLRMPVTLDNVAEAFAVTAVLSVLLLGIGNMLSVRYPRSVDPAQSWRTGSVGKVQAYLLFLYPVAGLPVILAYGARYAFESEIAFYAVMAVNLVIAGIVYFVAMESAVATAISSREQVIQALSKNQGPVGS